MNKKGIGTELFSMRFVSVANGGKGFAGTGPVAGVWWLHRLSMLSPARASGGVGSKFGFAFGSTVPATQAEFDGLEGLFPRLFVDGAERRVIQFVGDDQVIVVEGRFVVEPNGREIVGSWANGSGATWDADVLLVMERVG